MPALVMKKPSSGGSAFCGCAAKYPASTSAPAMPVIAGPLLLICLDPLCLCVHEKPPNGPDEITSPRRLAAFAMLHNSLPESARDALVR